jgi:NADP-dependent 3-hydroxy acid dehydrogenase YdfG
VVRTEIIQPEILDFMETNGTAMLEAEDISQAVLYVLGTPPRVQVCI